MGWDGERISVRQATAEEAGLPYVSTPATRRVARAARRARCLMGQHQPGDLVRGLCPFCCTPTLASPETT